MKAGKAEWPLSENWSSSTSGSAWAYDFAGLPGEEVL